MGIPKFFRWCSERYPLTVKSVKDHLEMPPVDNLYLDMNGILHVCARQLMDGSTPGTDFQERVARNIFAYIDLLFTLVRPQKYFMMAIDGVAPRAKMNQQRQRRFRNILDMSTSLDQNILSNGGPSNSCADEEHSPFDTNCITPGTKFMCEISEHLEYYVHWKMTTHAGWRKCRIIYSSHQCPGEGEHKIMELIRKRKMEPDYDSNESHCMYGLDADLIMLALASHEPNFILLREIVVFENLKARLQKEDDTARGIVCDQKRLMATEFVVFHINLLREYIYLDLKPTCLERTIDDFVFMCFFVGNDFLPALPTLGIAEGYLNEMMRIYSEEFATKGKSLTNVNKTINWDAVELFLRELAKLEWVAIETRKKAFSKQSEIDHSQTITSRATDLEHYKNLYYSEKLGFEADSPEVRNLVASYLHGLQWVYNYYYDGCCSWNWFFPFHYAPMISDISNIQAVMKCVKFSLGRPFTPYQQLLAVLPPQSFKCVPEALWDTMLSPRSPLAQYSPDIPNMIIDREGTRNSWEGILPLPFVDEDILIQVYNTLVPNFTEDDRHYNRQIPSFEYFHDSTRPPWKFPSTIRGLEAVQSCTVHRKAMDLTASIPFIPRPRGDFSLFSSCTEGFSTFAPQVNSLGVITKITENSPTSSKARSSRYPVSIVSFPPPSTGVRAADLKDWIGKKVFVGFPHYRRAIVTSIRDDKESFLINDDVDLTSRNCTISSICKVEHTSSMQSRIQADHNNYLRKLVNQGIDVPQSDTFVFAKAIKCLKWSKRGYVLPILEETASMYPWQLVVPLDELKVIPDGRFTSVLPQREIPVGTEVLYLPKKGNQLYVGLPGIVREIHHKQDNSREKLLYDISISKFDAWNDIKGTIADLAKHIASEKYFGLSSVCQKLNLKPSVLLTLSGFIRSQSNFGSLLQHEMGLGFFDHRKCLARPKYARRTSGQKADKASTSVVRAQDWLYTSSAVTLLVDFCIRFRPYVESLENCDPNAYDPDTMMVNAWAGQDKLEKIEEIKAYIESTDIAQDPLIPAMDQILSDQTVEFLEKMVMNSNLGTCHQSAKEEIPIKNANQRDLYVPFLDGTNVSSSKILSTKYHILDRVIYCDVFGSVPFGATGYIIRILSQSPHAEVLMDKEHIDCTDMSGRLKTNRGCLLKLSSLFVVHSFQLSEEIQDGKTGTEAVESTDSQTMKSTEKANKPDSPVMSGQSSGIHVSQIKFPKKVLLSNKSTGELPAESKNDRQNTSPLSSTTPHGNSDMVGRLSSPVQSIANMIASNRVTSPGIHNAMDSRRDNEKKSEIRSLGVEGGTSGKESTPSKGFSNVSSVAKLIENVTNRSRERMDASNSPSSMLSSPSSIPNPIVHDSNTVVRSVTQLINSAITISGMSNPNTNQINSKPMKSIAPRTLPGTEYTGASYATACAVTKTSSKSVLLINPQIQTKPNVASILKSQQAEGNSSTSSNVKPPLVEKQVCPLGDWCLIRDPQHKALYHDTRV